MLTRYDAVLENEPGCVLNVDTETFFPVALYDADPDLGLEADIILSVTWAFLAWISSCRVEKLLTDDAPDT